MYSTTRVEDFGDFVYRVVDDGNRDRPRRKVAVAQERVPDFAM